MFGGCWWVCHHRYALTLWTRCQICGRFAGHGVQLLPRVGLLHSGTLPRAVGHVADTVGQVDEPGPHSNAVAPSHKAEQLEFDAGVALFLPRTSSTGVHSPAL